MYGIGLVIILVFMGGAIAYIGDKLGTKVGKKRLSMFGLRPKHTSIIVTIITGILITSLTLGILTLASENVRVALFGLEKLNRQIAATESSLNEITVQLDGVKAERDTTMAELKKAQADYSVAMSDLERAREQIQLLEQTKNTLQEQKEKLDLKVSSLSDERDKLEGDINRLQVLTRRLSEGIQFVREGEIMYRAGEVVVSTVISYQKDAGQLEKDLVGVLSVANQNILERLRVKEPLEAIWISQGEFDEALNALKASESDMIVRIVAAGNIVYGEPVRVQIALFPNTKVYEENQMIYEKVYDFVNNDEIAAEQLVLNFLKEVNSIAVKRGVLPDPLQGSVGVMNGAQFYEIVNQVQPLRHKLKLTAFAAESTNAIGPLRLKIVVEDLNYFQK